MDNCWLQCHAHLMKKLILFLVLTLSTQSLFAALATPVLNFKVDGSEYVVDKVTDGHGIIWSMAFLSETKILFTEVAGKIHILDLASGSVRTMKNPPVVFQSGQGGLLDIALHPDFKNNKWVYVTYSKKIGARQTTAFARAKLDPAKEEFDKWTDLFVAMPLQSTAHHYGSRITFDKNDHVFVTVGERGQAELAQDLKAHMGKIIRLKTDGTIPLDNPFVGRMDAKPEIWTYGHRNPQGIFFDEASGVLYAIEHGPQGGDEINLIEKGKNYGWPVITYGEQYGGGPIGGGETSRAGMEQPLKYFTPSIAPSNFFIYRHTKLKLFKDRFVSSALALQHLNVIDVKDCKSACEDRLLVPLDERLRSVNVSPDGLVYVSSDKGRIYRIKNHGAK